MEYLMRKFELMLPLKFKFKMYITIVNYVIFFIIKLPFCLLSCLSHLKNTLVRFDVQKCDGLLHLEDKTTYYFKYNYKS